MNAPSALEPLFRLRDVSCGTLQHLNLEIFPGFTAITGPSGGGKTTLLRLLAKMRAAESGQIWFDGRSLEQWDAVELRRQVVTCPQQAYIWPGTVAENLQVGLRLQNRRVASDQELEEVLAVVALAARPDEDCGRLSGGERARLAMARSLLCQQKVALWDEPTAALDERSVEEIFPRILEYLRQRELDLLLVTHDQRLFGWAERQIVIEAGRVRDER